MLNSHISDIDISDLSKLILEHGLLVIETDGLELNEFENIASKLGKPLVTTKHVINEERTVQELSNNGLFANNDVDWHHDWSYGRGNYFGTVLYNVSNAHLSSTWFCDMSKAPQELKDLYTDAVGKYYPPMQLHGQCFTEKQLRILEKQGVERPFIINHHITDEEILYCSVGTLTNRDDFDVQPIIDWSDENAYKHEWKDNQILVWDNLKMNHRRFSFEGERMLWRTQFWI